MLLDLGRCKGHLGLNHSETIVKCTGCQDPILSYFFGKILFCPIFWEMAYLILFLAILPLILVFYSLFITIISHENIS